MTMMESTNWIDMTGEVVMMPDKQFVRYTKGHIKCKFCGSIQYLMFEKNYCPNCGKDMRKHEPQT